MNQRIGYARVSTDDQNLGLQRDALRLAGVGSIYEEAVSGKAAVRQELEHCLKALRAGDTLVVWRLDILGGNLSGLVNILAGLEKKGIDFESIIENIETTGAAGKLVFRVFAALAEFERALTRERTRAGLVAARARGRAGGRKPKLDARQIREIKSLMSDPTIPVGQIAERYNVSRTTIYKVAPRSDVTASEPQSDASKKMSHRQDVT
jgi:DNA invertase Pin-like site-specific DNA recombinase